MAFIDEYEIGRSEQFTITGREEKTEVLSLAANAAAVAGNLTGTVTSGGTALSGATVKVYDTNDNPIEHTNTGGNGQYTIANLPVGSYKVVAIKNGYLLPLSIPISIQKNKTTTVNISLTVDPDGTKGAIYGIIRASIGETPIESAIVNLYNVVSGEPTLFGTSVTNSQGQYVFTYLNAGDYYATASKLGYLSNTTATINLDTSEYVDSEISLIADPQANTATVSGFINDAATGLPIASAIVVLYSIASDVETIIAITKTSASGKYLFASINPGNYLVKSTKQVEG